MVGIPWLPLLRVAELLMSPVMKEDSCFLTVSFHMRLIRLCTKVKWGSRKEGGGEEGGGEDIDREKEAGRWWREREKKVGNREEGKIILRQRNIKGRQQGKGRGQFVAGRAEKEKEKAKTEVKRNKWEKKKITRQYTVVSAAKCCSGSERSLSKQKKKQLMKLTFQKNMWKESESEDPTPGRRALASPESPLCCSVQLCRQESSPVSLWSSGPGSVRWWSYWRRRWWSPRSCHCSSECADICHTPYAPERWRKIDDIINN